MTTSLQNQLILAETHFWTEKLGLMPVPLRSTNDSMWIMLNGAKGNFCLSLPAADIPMRNAWSQEYEPQGIAWSSNVGHHVSVTQQAVEVQRWDSSPFALERFSPDSIARNLEAFYSHIEKTTPSAENSVVTHAIRTFRRLRAAFPETQQDDGIKALKAFLLLLACGVENQPEASFSWDNWSLPEDTREAYAEISPDDWQALYNSLTQQLPREQLRLHLDLTLRHASGQLFQEAHFEAYRSPQMSLSLGLPPAPITVKMENRAAGLHFTPPALVRVLVEESLRLTNLNSQRLVIFDPACGSGEFLREALRQLRLKNYRGMLHLIGWDISEAACDMARFTLRREKEDWIGFGEAQISIQLGDSLAEDKIWPTNVDLVLMNPPFVTWREMTGGHKNSVERMLLPRLEVKKLGTGGNYDLSHVFFVQAAHCLAPQGIIASILPASFLDAKAAEKVRGHLSEELNAHLIARLGSHSLFSNALVDAAFYIGQNAETRQTIKTSPPLAFWSDYRPSSSSTGFRALRRTRTQSFRSEIIEATEEDKTGFCFYVQPDLGRNVEQWLPRPAKAWKLLQRLRYLPKVEDIFILEQGINTGSNKAFILTLDEWRSLFVKERAYFRPTVFKSGLSNGRLQEKEFVFYPYEDKSIENEDELQRVLKRYFELKLRNAKEDLLKRPEVREDKWWLLNRSRPLQYKPTPKIISNHFGSGGSYAWDESGEFTVVQGHAWFPPRLEIQDAETGDEEFDEARFQNEVGLAYSAILNSSIFFRLVSAVSHHVSGGQWDLSQRYVKQLPIPNFYLDRQANPTLIEELAEIGRAIQKNGLGEEGLSTEALTIVARSYGLTFEDI